MNRREIAQKMRANILNLVGKSPGIHFHGIRRKLKISSGSLAYHIKKLDEIGEIFSETEGYWKRFYPISMKSKRRPLALTPMQREVVIFIERHPGAAYKDLVKAKGRTRQLYMYHIGKLIERGFVRMKKQGVKHTFYLTRKKFL